MVDPVKQLTIEQLLPPDARSGPMDDAGLPDHKPSPSSTRSSPRRQVQARVTELPPPGRSRQLATVTSSRIWTSATQAGVA